MVFRLRFSISVFLTLRFFLHNVLNVIIGGHCIIDRNAEFRGILSEQCEHTEEVEYTRENKDEKLTKYFLIKY